MYTYDIPSHCSHAIVFDRALMFVFDPITLPFTFQTRSSDAEDFFVKHCLSCGLRVRYCNEFIGNCKLYIKPKYVEGLKTIQMPYPTHMVIMQISGSSYIRIVHEDGDALNPLRLGNIYDHGGWCYGDINLDYRDPTCIYRGFFNGIHNTDLTEFPRSDTTLYEEYLEKVAANFLKHIERGDKINLSNYGEVQVVYQQPRKITYHYDRIPNSYRVRDQYVTFS